MGNLNSVLIEGNLTRDAELRGAPDKLTICVFTLGTMRIFRQGSTAEIKKEVSFFSVEARGKLAEECYARGKKGQGVRVVGRLKQGRLAGDDCARRQEVFIAAEHIEFRPGKSGAENESNGN